MAKKNRDTQRAAAEAMRRRRRQEEMGSDVQVRIGRPTIQEDPEIAVGMPYEGEAVDYNLPPTRIQLGETGGATPKDFLENAPPQMSQDAPGYGSMHHYEDRSVYAPQPGVWASEYLEPAEVPRGTTPQEGYRMHSEAYSEAAAPPDRVVQEVLRDPNLSPEEKTRILRRLLPKVQSGY